MTKYDALFIRAIKSRSPDRRLKRLYSKFYFSEYSDYHFTNILSRIVDEYKIMKTKDWIDALNPDNAWKYGTASTDSYYVRCVAVMCSYVRLTRVSDIPNYPIPASWRNK